MWSIERTESRTRENVLDVVRLAFSGATQDGEEEAEVVRRTWASEARHEIFDFLAIEDRDVVGHVIAGQGDLAGHPAIGIAPLSVRPGHQRLGIGSDLMGHLLKELGARGWPFALLLGDPDYYGRFGFQRASRFGIEYPPVGPSPAFQVCLLREEPPEHSGSFRYCFE